MFGLKFIRSLQLLLAIFALFVSVNASAQAGDLINAGLKVPSIDLLGVLEQVETDKPQVSVKVPAAKGQSAVMSLQARGPGPVYRWALVSMLNTDPVAHDLVLVVRHQKLGGSGLIWPRPQGSPLYSLSHQGDAVISALNYAGYDAYAFRIEPNAMQTFALELTPAGLQSITLQQRVYFDANAGSWQVQNGLMLGAALLLLLGMLAAVLTRFRLTFAAGGLFLAAGYVLLGTQAGYLPLVPERLLASTVVGQRISAVSEALLAAGLCLLILTLIDLRRTHQFARHILVAALSGAFVLAAYGVYAPEIAQAGARILFAIMSVLGLGLAIRRWFLRDANARLSFIVFLSIFLWVGCVAYAVITPPNSIYAALVSGLLLLAMMMVSFALLPQALGVGIGSRFEDSARRALALAGAGHAVWDWHVERGSLFVGLEMDRALGLEPGSMQRLGEQGFVELIHESDRSAYMAAVENAERRGRGSFQQRFRMRRRDGSLRSFLLRARAMPGSSGRAVRLIGAIEDITEQRHAEERMIADAVHDRITGLPNRAIFLDRLETALRRGRNATGEIAGLHVLIIDLDRFRTVNEGLGYAQGDNLLAVTARRLQSLLGPEDTLARLYGDQFGILFEGARPRRTVASFIDSMRRSISRPVALRPREVYLTGSIGVVAVQDMEVGAESLLKDAEIALYEAKRRGKDQVEHFSSDMREAQLDRISLEKDLRKALERKEIEIVYQPIHRLKGDDLAGVEALMRWHHPTHGLLLPDDFISIAEQAGLLGALGGFALNEAARQLGTWQRTYRKDPALFVAVNVSSSQLLSAELVAQVEELIHREGLVPGSLRIELTESMVIQNPELAAEIMQRLKELGAGLACDDFGTGYSSLALLRRLPFDTLKIDRSFLVADSNDERAQVILESIVKMAHELDMMVVAEGVERPDQLSRLQDLRCDYAQGFHFGEPMVARRVSERLGGLGFIKSRNSRFNWSRLIGRDDKPMNAKTQPAKASDLASRHVTKDKLHDQVFTKPSKAEVADQVEAPIENVTVDEVPAPLEAIDTPETSVDVVELPVEPEVKLPSKREYKPLSAELRQKFAPSNRSFTREPHQSLLRPPKREFTPPVEETKPSPLRDSLRDRLRENSRHQPVPENSATRVRPPLPRLQMTDGQSAIELLKSFRSMMEKAEGPQKQAEEQATTADGGEKPKD